MSTQWDHGIASSTSPHLSSFSSETRNGYKHVDICSDNRNPRYLRFNGLFIGI